MASISLRVNIVKLGTVKTLKVRRAIRRGAAMPPDNAGAAAAAVRWVKREEETEDSAYPCSRSAHTRACAHAHVDGPRGAQFAGSMGVNEVCKDIREKLGEETGGADHGLFWPDTGKWLDARRTLDYYDLKSGVRGRRGRAHGRARVCEDAMLSSRSLC